MVRIDTNAMIMAADEMERVLEEGKVDKFVEIGQALLNVWYGDINSSRFQDSLMNVNENTDFESLKKLAGYPRQVALAYEEKDRQCANMINSLFG